MGRKRRSIKASKRSGGKVGKLDWKGASDAVGEVVSTAATNAMTSAVGLMAQVLQQTIGEPLRQIGAGLIKDMQSGITSKIDSVFEPRNQARDVAQQFAAAGHALSREEFDQYFKLLVAESERKAQAVSFANQRMPAATGALWDNVFNPVWHDMTNISRQNAAIQAEIQNNWRVQARE